MNKKNLIDIVNYISRLDLLRIPIKVAHVEVFSQN